MDIPDSCEGCFPKQMRNLEAVSGERQVVLCPLLASLALSSANRPPLIERHFLSMSEQCATESNGEGGVYTIQLVQGARAVETLVAIQNSIAQTEAIQEAAA